MDTLPLLVSLGLFLTVALVFIGIAMPRSVDPVQSRLTAYGSRIRTLEEIELEKPFADRAVKPVLQGMASFVLRFAPRANLENLRRRLDMAGNPNNWSPSDFL
jgi:hypothetical protein